ncbi:NADP-dependent oxidoreductase domain-containing protein [Syncephalastrum racemosum]|uniref:NADP-dependent oxidoreductase domain-containing protein n=1 Tax=Syncephalastrum racemosum TaxID=13706 RepID=A0A1X2HPP0_SYNRA|nr:NADP-dependent oxidoreductase domain-containing protein [Syncephalastrum racemosum]
MTGAIKNKTYKLNTGALMPAIGLGTWQSPDDQVYEAVKTAIKTGYRHIDTAFAYSNEKAVGRAIRDALAENNLKRSDLFVTTKLWNTYHRPELVPVAFQKSLENLDIEYIDLYLMHWPVSLAPTADGTLLPKKPDGANDIDQQQQGKFNETWAAMEELLDTGKVKAIGISNFAIPNIEKLLATAKVIPAVNQVELHPYLPQQKLFDYCNSKGIHLSAYSPLGSTDSALMKDETLLKIAESRKKTPAHVILSWGAARTSILPKSVTPSRIVSNFDLFDLTSEELKEVDALASTKGQRLIQPKWGVPVFDEEF